MKIHAIPMCLASACWLALAPAAAAAPPPAARVIAAPDRCASGVYEGKVQQVQLDLHRIFSGDHDYQEDAAGPYKLLADGKLGAITRKWLKHACTVYPFMVRPDHADADLAAALHTFTPPGAVIVVPSAPGPAAAAPVPIEVTYRYDPAALRSTRQREAIVPRLRLLTDRFSDKRQFDDAVARVLPGHVPDAATLGQIETYSALDAYVLPVAGLDQLVGASPALLERLGAATGVVFESADDFHIGLDTAVGDGPERAELRKYAAQVDQLSRTTHYRIPPTLAADLADATALAPPVAALYRSMINVAYPSEALLQFALRAHLARKLGLCSQKHETDDADVLALWTVPDSAGDKSARVIALRHLPAGCNADERREANVLTDVAHASLYATLAKTVDLAKVNVAPAAAGQNGPGAVAACGCAPDARAAMTYGFYPLWADATGQALDFDVLSRVGLYGMTIDDQGALTLPAGVQGKPWTLLKAAHRHLTKVDWVLSKTEWRAVDGAGMAAFFGKLRQNVAQLLASEVPAPRARGTAVASLGLEQGPVAGDGITLRFDGFPTDAQHQNRDALRSFVQALATDLRAMKPARQLNIMVTQAQILGAPGADSGDRPFSASNLNELIRLANPIRADADPAQVTRSRANDPRILVMLQEPTADAKLLLRAGIEQGLSSEVGMRVLRDVIPVVEYDGQRAAQLNEDILYFRDNFAGIGFWTVQFYTKADDNDGAASANAILRRHFKAYGVDGGFISGVIDLICPNRGWLRWLAWIAAIVAVAAGVTLVRCRGCSKRLDSNVWYRAGMVALVVLPFIVIAALVVGDPLFKSESGVHWLVAAVLIAVVVVPGIYGLLKPVKRLP